ncbi:MAG: hypothetical protein ACRC62_33095 [Microcoleus sp.]
MHYWIKPIEGWHWNNFNGKLRSVQADRVVGIASWRLLNFEKFVRAIGQPATIRTVSIGLTHGEPNFMVIDRTRSNP